MSVGQDGFEDISLLLQVLATIIGLAICLYEAIYPSRVKVRDNKERFEEYKRRYKWEMFNTESLLREDSEDEVPKPIGSSFLADLPGKRAEMQKE